MYFPYLRGKQFELIALRELVDILNPGKVIPIIEPLKRNTKSIVTAATALAKKDIRIQLIVNPQYGELVNRSNDVVVLINELANAGVNNIIPTFLVNSNRDYTLLRDTISENNYDNSGYALVHLNQTNTADELSAFAKGNNCLYSTIQINHHLVHFILFKN